MYPIRGLLCTAILLAGVHRADAADICTAIAVRDVPALEDSTSVIKKGGLDDSITEYRVNKRTGQTSFCSHGGYCYPTRIQVGGDLLETLRLTNCRVVEKQPAFTDDEFLVYEVEPIRTKVSPALLRYDDLDNRFLQLGLCSACADNVTQFYMNQPASRCASLARAALEGNPDALRTLQSDPPYCTWHYPPQMIFRITFELTVEAY
jgi:hypothetical protein